MTPATYPLDTHVLDDFEAQANDAVAFGRSVEMDPVMLQRFITLARDGLRAGHRSPTPLHAPRRWGR